MSKASVIGLQSPPHGGYSEAYFATLIARMEKQLEDMTHRKDPRAVFQLTYLTFSKHVYENLLGGSFTNQHWATDMCCRFVEIYLLQMQLWEEKSPEQCRTWREALELMEKGKLNVLQCMFLGMNAHINYDLAFCTLGACLANGDALLQSNHSSSDTQSMRNLEDRYRDYLQINHVGWRSITHIQDEVLDRFHPVLGIFNRWGTKISKPLSLRVLMASRDQAWRRTVLLMHAQSEEEAEALAQLIDHSALRWSHAIQTISVNPLFAHRAIRKWQSGSDVSRETFFRVLLDMLKRDNRTSHLLMAELAFAGAGSVVILEQLLSLRELEKARQWSTHICEYGTSSQFESLVNYLKLHASACTSIILNIRVNSRTPKQRIKPLLRLKKSVLDKRLSALLQYAQHNEINNFGILLHATLSEVHHIKQQIRMYTSHDAIPQPILKAMSEDTNPWLSYLAKGVLSHLGGGVTEDPIVEAVLFLKDSPIFSSIQTEYLYALCKHVEIHHHVKGEFIIRQGEASRGIWIITSGSVHISGENQKVISLLGPYDVVGELSCIGGIPTTANAIAEEPTSAYFIHTDDFMSALRDAPEIALNLMKTMVKRLSQTSHTLMTKSDVTA